MVTTGTALLTSFLALNVRTITANVALGDRRAGAAKDYLVGIGIPSAQLNLIQLRQRTPGLPGGRRSLLAAESPHSHHCHGSNTEIIGAKRSAIKQHACLATARVSLLVSSCEAVFDPLDCDAAEVLRSTAIVAAWSNLGQKSRRRQRQS